MKSSLLIPLVIVTLLTSVHAGADVNKGFAAAEARDYATAAQEFKNATEQGDARAQTFLGAMYRDGEGVLQDYKEAVRWFRLAAEQGLAQGHLNLALM